MKFFHNVAYVLLFSFLMTTISGQYQALDLSLNRMPGQDSYDHLAAFDGYGGGHLVSLDVAYSWSVSDHFVLRPILGLGLTADRGMNFRAAPPGTFNPPSYDRQITYIYLRLGLAGQYYLQEGYKGLFLRGEASGLFMGYAKGTEGPTGIGDRIALDVKDQMTAVVPQFRLEVGYDLQLPKKFSLFVTTGITVKPLAYRKMATGVDLIGNSLSLGIKYVLKNEKKNEDAIAYSM